MNKNKCIKIWPFKLAPEEYKISIHGGDEDWVIEVPLEIIENFGYCPLFEYDENERWWVNGFGWGKLLLKDDNKIVIIFAHA